MFMCRIIHKPLSEFGLLKSDPPGGMSSGGGAGGHGPPHHISHISSHATFSVIPDYQRLGPNKGLEVSRLKLDLTEWHAGSIHLLTVEFSEFDVTGN